MQDDDTLACIIDYANTAFRDSADQDYISARFAHRNELDQQFRWNALQAVEKYFKAILLYNGCSTKSLRHDVAKALGRVREIPDLGFGVPECNEKFIEYLNIYCSDRYLSHPTHTPERALVSLDETVWLIRRYCFYMRSEYRANGNVISMLEPYKRNISRDLFKKFPNRYRLANGYLERVLDRKLPSYNALVWKNPFFGKVKKHRIKIRDRFAGTSPIHYNFPDCFAALDALVYFPREVRREFSRPRNST